MTEFETKMLELAEEQNRLLAMIEVEARGARLLLNNMVKKSALQKLGDRVTVTQD